ncbi:MAG: heparan-alpha-glucosaminide N-acetyltransferase [Rubrivivax sp.]
MATSVPVPAARGERFDRLDALRGVAMVWMAGFHLCFDLNLYRLMPAQNFYRDPFWLNQRTCIVSLFLFCAGVAQAVALQSRRESGAALFPPRFWRRWAQVAGCAVLVSIGSFVMFPKSWISFGVLHGLAEMLVLVRLASPLPGWALWPMAAVAIVLPKFVQDPFFNQPFAHWTGLVTKKPITEDWVPVLPWLGVMLIGLAAGRWLLANRRDWIAGPVPRAVQPLALLGRWPLTFYMLHQPVFLGVILGGRALGAW